MNTLMTPEIFDELGAIRDKLNVCVTQPAADGRPAGIFVPWAGPRLIKEGGIYYVGMATDGEYGADGPQTFEARLKIARSLCNNKRRDRARTQFWQFLDGLTWALLGGSFDETSDRWGWSNLLKIGWSNGSPNRWSKSVRENLINKQNDVCARSLAYEFANLRNSLIVIVSGDNKFNILDSIEIFPKLISVWDKGDWNKNWDKSCELQTGVWSVRDANTGNLYVYCYHPRYAVMDGFWGSALGRILHLARAMPFASN